MRNILFFGFLFINALVKGQFLDKYYGNWIIEKVETIDSTKLNNDLGFTRMQIQNNAKIDLFRGNPTDEFNRHQYSCIYVIIDKKFQIKCDSIMEFQIEKITDNEFVFTRYNERYSFNKLLIQENAGLFRSNDYKIIGKDTSVIAFAPSFSGDIIKFFSINGNSKSSNLIKAKFILRRNKIIDSINVLTLNLDSTIIYDVINKIRKSQKKWSPASTLNFKKGDTELLIYILFGSSEMSNLNQLNYYNIGQNIFSKAIEYYNNKQYELAELFYTDYINLYQYLIHNTFYIGLGATQGYIEYLNNGLINRAAIRLTLGRIDDACKDLKMVGGNKKDAEEAEKYIKEYCK